MRAEKPVTIEVNHMLRGIGNPDFSLPSNISSEAAKALSVQESGNVDNACRTLLREVAQHLSSDLRHWIGGMNRFDQKKPVLTFGVGDNIRQFVMGELEEMERGKSGLV